MLRTTELVSLRFGYPFEYLFQGSGSKCISLTNKERLILCGSSFIKEHLSVIIHLKLKRIYDFVEREESRKSKLTHANCL